MCYRECTPLENCILPDYHGHNAARQVHAFEFKAYPNYTYVSHFPGYIPCRDVLEGRIDAKDCIAKGVGKRGWSKECPICNYDHVDSGHRVVTERGVMVSATLLAGKEHQYEMRLAEKCGTCANEFERKNGMGIVEYWARQGVTIEGPTRRSGGFGRN